MITNKLETRSPSPQVTVDIFKDHWASDLAEVLPSIKSGTAPLFEQEGRPREAAAQLGSNGSLKGMRVLELGPLEEAHTYQLEKLGAPSVLAIEANTEARSSFSYYITGSLRLFESVGWVTDKSFLWIAYYRGASKRPVARASEA